MKLTNKFIIIIPVYNAKDLIEECLLSVISQDFDDCGIIIRDDISTDGTDLVIKQLFGINEDLFLTKFNDKDVLYIRNQTKLYPLGNTYESVINYVDNDDAIIGIVDGDDKLVTNSALKKIFDVYDKHDKWLVWAQHRKSSGGIGESKKLPPNEIIYETRNYWSCSHFRTSKAFLFKKLNKEDLLDPYVENSYFTFAGDAAFLYPFCEMSGNEKSYFLDEVLYLYNNNLETNEHNKSYKDAVKYGVYVKVNSNRYNKLIIE